MARLNARPLPEAFSSFSSLISRSVLTWGGRNANLGAIDLLLPPTAPIHDGYLGTIPSNGSSYSLALSQGRFQGMTVVDVGIEIGDRSDHRAL